MKIRLLSDLHMEGVTHEYTYCGEEVLVLDGDIITGNRLHTFVSQVPKGVKILFVAGNHEYYHDVVEDVNCYLRSLEGAFPNFQFLQDQATVIDDVHFFGGTMFSDFKLYDNPLSKVDSMRNINDFHLISKKKNSDPDSGICFWTVDDHEEAHEAFCEKLDKWMVETSAVEKRVVITHFVPHPKLIHERYAMMPVNAYFTSDMSRYMGFKGLWLYGHTHDGNDIMLGDTRVVGNPKGWRNEKGNFDPDLIIEI